MGLSWARRREATVQHGDRDVARAVLFSVQILLNYLPLERASWTSILAKQR